MVSRVTFRSRQDLMAEMSRRHIGAKSVQLKSTSLNTLFGVVTLPSGRAVYYDVSTCCTEGKVSGYEMKRITLQHVE